MLKHSAHYLQFRRRLIAGFIILVLFVVSLLVWKEYSTYDSEKETARSQTQSFVRAMKAHVLSSVQVVDLSLISVLNSVKLMKVDELAANKVTDDLLVAAAGGHDSNFRLLFINPQGIGVSSSDGLPVAGVSYADRDYFQAHTGEVDKGLYIGRPAVGKVSKRRNFFMSRRVMSAGGTFLGVVVAPIDASRFATVFSNALFSPDLSITLAHTDGMMIARAPRFEESFGVSLLKTELFRNLKIAPSGSYLAPSVIDGDSRIYSYEVLDSLPLVISVGIASNSWIKPIRDDLPVVVVSLSLVIIVMLLSGRFALASYARLEQSETGYRDLYAEVQAAERRLTNSERRIRTITDNLPMLIAYIDKEQIFRFGNATFETWLSLPLSTMINQPIAKILGPRAYRRWRIKIERALAGERMEFETEVMVQGGIRSLHTVYVPERTSDGTVVGMYTLSTDITDVREGEKRIRTITNNLPALVSYIDRHERYVFFNSMYQKVPGIDASAMAGKTIAEVFGTPAYEHIRNEVARALAGETQSFERQVWNGGVERHMQYEYIPDITADGKVLGFYTMVTDITDRKLAENKVYESETLLRAVTDHVPALLSCISLDERYLFNNAAYAPWLDRPLTEITGRTVAEVYGAEAVARHRPYFERAKKGERVDFEFESTRTGTVRHYSAVYVPQYNAAGTVTNVCAMVTDVTRTKQIEQQLLVLARVDSLTGLANRNQLYERLGHAIARSHRNGTALACLYLDIDHFKQVNDNFGHAGGDAVLKEFGARLTACVRETDLVVRLAGDEFVIVLEGLQQPRGAERVAEKILDVMTRPFDIDGTSRVVTTSIGIVTSDAQDVDPDGLLKQADEALYRAKRDGRNAFATTVLEG
ncbi:MAG: PAS domain-containing protein [Herminiimonas sp.]|nr:PAS domain-containing protein [Herminiimonas sp.]